MPASLESLSVTAHAAALLVIPPLVALLVRERARRALAGGGDSAPVYFASAQWLGHLPAVVMIALLASVGSPLGFRLHAVASSHAGPYSALLLLPVVMVPLAGATLVSTAVLHDVTRSTRGTELSLAENLRQAGWVLTSVGAAFAGTLSLMAALAAGTPVPGVLALAVSIALAAWAHGRWSRHVGLEPHAVTHGPLRDRLVALAEAAGVRVGQLYVLPQRRTQMANAFAVRGDVVMLTDWLLEHLERREVEAVLAHELAHIRLGHPRKLALAAAAGAILGGVVGPFWNFGFAVVTGTLLSILGVRLLSRRYEYAADALAVQICRDPEALVTGLARLSRLNHVPLHWGRLAESGLTHPSTWRRIEAIGRAAGLPPERLRALVAGIEPPRDLEPVPATAESAAKRFSTSFKTGVGNGLAWGQLLVAAVLAVAAVTIVDRLALPRPLAVTAAALGAFAGLWALTDRLAARAIARLRAPLAERLRAGTNDRFVGLAPGASHRVYEGCFDWDVGFLSLQPAALVYRGEEAAFRLPRAAITHVERVCGPPGWIASPRIAIEWRNPATGEREVVQLRPAHSTRLSRLRIDTSELKAELDRWLADAQDAPEAACDPPPRERDVTGMDLAYLSRPATLVPAALLSGMATALVAAACGLSYWPFAGPGAFDAWAGACLALTAQRLPVWWTRSPAR